MISFFHGFGTIFFFPLLYLPFLLLGYLISDKIQRRTTRWVWLGILFLGLILCDVFFLMRNYGIIGLLLNHGAAWAIMQMLLGQGVCALIRAIKSPKD